MMMMGGPSGPGATPAWYPSPTLQEDWTQHFAQQQAQQQMQMQLQHQMQQQFAKDFRWDQLSKEEQAAHLQQAQLQVQQQQAHQQQSRLFMPQSMMYAQSPMFANHGNNAQTGNASVAQAMMMRGPPPPTPLHMLSMLADTERHVPVPSSAEGQPSSANTVGTHSPPPSSPTTEAPSLRAPPVGRKKRAEASNAQSLVSPPMSYAKSKRTVETYDEADSSRFLCPHPDW